MKNKRLKLTGMIFLLFLSFAVVFPGITAKAESGSGYLVIEKNSKQTVTCSAVDKKVGYLLDIHNILPKNAKKIKVTSSRKSVASIRKEKWGDCFFLKPKKTGTTKLTISAVAGKKKVKYTNIVKVVNFRNPFKALKINGKSYLKQIKGASNYINIENSKIKLDCKLKSGWKIELVDVSGYRKKSIKNNRVYTFERCASGGTVLIRAKNKKTGEGIYINIYY